jgi:hypothetical protein
MSRTLVCVASWASGVRHRFAMLSAARRFANHFDYSIRMLWGASRGVAYCRYEELFAPLARIRIENISEEEVKALAAQSRNASHVNYRGESFRVFYSGKAPAVNCFVYDLVSSGRLANLVPGHTSQIWAMPCRAIRTEADAYIKQNGLATRLGIRVRVTETMKQQRKPHRVQSELNEVIKSIIRIPWHTRVFVATDSEYIQQMLASHFHYSSFFPKAFDLTEANSRYVHRQDKRAMVTFLKEVYCICACSRIINIGGFLNERFVRDKVIEVPFREAARAVTH